MHRKSRFLVGLATAAITFGSLWFTLGPSHFNRGHRMCCGMEHHCFRKENSECCEQSEKQNTRKVIVIKELVKNDSIKK